jgi:hypothetical protein
MHGAAAAKDATVMAKDAAAVKTTTAAMARAAPPVARVIPRAYDRTGPEGSAGAADPSSSDEDGAPRDDEASGRAHRASMYGRYVGPLLMAQIGYRPSEVLCWMTRRRTRSVS